MKQFLNSRSTPVRTSAARLTLGWWWPCDEMTASSCLDLAWPCWPLPGPGSIAQPRARINSRHHRSPASQPRVLQQTTPPPPQQPPGDGALVKDAWCTCSHRVSFILATSSQSPEPASSSSMVCTTVYLKGVATVSALFYVYSLGLTAHFDLNKITGSKNIFYQSIIFEICIHLF